MSNQGYKTLESGPPREVRVVTERPNDYMIPAILTCLCCFWPTGICAIYYASQANSAANAGDTIAAEQYNNTARALVIASIILGLITAGVVVAVNVA